MRTNDIIELGMLSDELFIKRFKQIRRVFCCEGIAPTIPAACGEGGGITPKIMVYEDTNNSTGGRQE